MRKTKQKDLILSIIQNSYVHPNANEVYQECKKTIPDISLGTVYRNLNLLADNGQIKRIKMPNNIDRFDKNHNHAHFICLDCGKVSDIMDDLLNNDISIKEGKVVDYEINFRGICQKCLKKEGEKLWN